MGEIIDWIHNPMGIKPGSLASQFRGGEIKPENGNRGKYLKIGMITTICNHPRLFLLLSMCLAITIG